MANPAGDVAMDVLSPAILHLSALAANRRGLFVAKQFSKPARSQFQKNG
jgi:hypothetical protein